MGSTKNKSPAQRERSQGAKRSDSKKKAGRADGQASQQATAEISVIMTDGQAAKALKSARAVTAHYMAKQAGVKISAAHAYLGAAAGRGVVKAVGGKSGHRVYAVLDTKIPERSPGMAATLGTTSGSSKSK